MSRKIKTAMVGIAGFGHHHLENILRDYENGPIELVAGVARRPERCPRLSDLKNLGVRIYNTLEDFYDHETAELVVISSPVHLHRPFTCYALEHGSHVFCEKPLAATVQDALAMADAQEKSGLHVAIGYQWSFSAAIQALKADVMAGELGKPLRLKTLVSWPRPRSYYGDRGWRGEMKTDDGEWILDSPVQNATAHYLHNALYILGDTRETSAEPVDVKAELYRANEIGNYDTAALRVHTDRGVEILFYTSHAVPSEIGPVISYEFEKAVVSHVRFSTDLFTARFTDGRTKSYGNPEDNRGTVLLDIAAGIRDGKAPACGIAAAAQHTVCMCGAQESAPEIAEFPSEIVMKEGEDDPLTYVRGLQGVMVECFDQAVLPCEHEAVNWARGGRTVDLKEYTHFPSSL